MIHLQLVIMLEVLSTVGTAPVLFFEQSGYAGLHRRVVSPAAAPIHPIPIVRTPIARDLGMKEAGGLIINWLRALDTAECSQVDQRVCHHLHAIMPLLYTFKAEQQPLEFVLPCKGPLDTHSQGMDGGDEERLAPALVALAVAWCLLNVGHN